MLSATPPQKNGVGENDLHDHCTNKTNDSYVQSSKIDIAQNIIYIVKWQFSECGGMGLIWVYTGSAVRN